MTLRDLDALVAQARGWTKDEYGWLDADGIIRGWNKESQPVLPPVSTDIAEAMGLVEELVATGLNVELHWRGGGVSCSVEEGDEVTAHYIAVADAPTASAAICLAYLKAKGVKA